MGLAIPEEEMTYIIKRTLERVRQREYVKCLQNVQESDDGEKAKIMCAQIAGRVKRFTIADFETEARIWIWEYRVWEYRVSSLIRKLRSWAKKGYIVRRVKPGVYEVIG